MKSLPLLLPIALVIGLRSVALAADASDSLANPLGAHPLDQLSATRERPLFAPSRRPPPPPPPPVVQRVEPPKPIDPPSVVLIGIVTEGGEARALIRTQSSNKVARARLGDEVGSWTVTAIEPRRLTLSHDDRSVSFALFAGSPAKNAAGNVPLGQPEPAVQTAAQDRVNRRNGRER
jgi:hypothetical protein